MSYSIQAVIAMSGALPAQLPPGMAMLQLNGGVALVPLGSAVRELYGLPFLPLTDEGSEGMPAVLCDVCSRLAVNGPIAYIEAEFFGGHGTQAHVLIAQRGVAARAKVSDNAINEALKWLGLAPVEGADEFDSVELGRHRDTDAWLVECRP